MTTKSKALHLADILENDYLSLEDYDATAAELRRLHEVNADLVEALAPFVLANSSEEFVTLVVRSREITKARAAIAKATGDTK